MKRIAVLAGGIICFIWTLRSMKKGSIYWRMPLWQDIKKEENPGFFYFSIALGFGLSFVAFAGAVGLIEIE